jgi:hypothetical protein
MICFIKMRSNSAKKAFFISFSIGYWRTCESSVVTNAATSHNNGRQIPSRQLTASFVHHPDNVRGSG